MEKWNVFAVSDWPESMGELLLVYKAKEFESKDHAKKAGEAQYQNLKIVVIKAK